MNELKNIYWRHDMPVNGKGEVYANVHLIFSHKQETLSNFRIMADELRKTFPQATDDEIQVGKIFQSSCVGGYKIVAWDAYIPRGDYPGWQQQDEAKVEYCW